MQNMIGVIDARTREETAPFVQASFPYRTEICDLNALPGRLCPWYWHNEVELFFMREGALTYHLPGRTCDFFQGDIGFINANVLHMTTALGTEACLQQEHIFLPRLVGGQPGDAIEDKYIAPLVGNCAAELIRIDANDPASPEMRAIMNRAFDAFYAKKPGFEMHIRNCLSELWLMVSDFSLAYARVPSGGDTSRIKAMLRYIEEHFAEPLTLDEISRAAQIGTREASRCFRRQLGMTAFEYVLGFRIDRASELLRESNRPITEIASRCGFTTASYFTKVFRERMGAVPRAYRLAHRQNNDVPLPAATE